MAKTKANYESGMTETTTEVRYGSGECTYKPEVSMMFCHQSVNIPTVANEKTVSDLKYKGIKMWWEPDGVHFEVKDKKGVVPAANIATVFFK